MRQMEFIQAGMQRKCDLRPVIDKHHKRTTIVVCDECGLKREIHVQSAYKVRYCKECQRKRRNKRIQRKGDHNERLITKGKSGRRYGEGPVIPDLRKGQKSDAYSEKFVF